MKETMGIGDLDDKQAIDIKLELCCDICNNPSVSVKREASDSSNNDTEDLGLQDGFADNINIKTDNINLSGCQHQNAINELQIKQEVNSDPDIEVDLAYKVIDTFNPCEVKIFKREGGKISPDTETLLKVCQTNITQPQLKVEVGKKKDYVMTSNLNVCEKEKLPFVKANVLKDHVSKNPVHQLQIKGM